MNNYFAFVIMPFKKENDDKYQMVIKEAAKEVGIKAERLDEQLFREGMIERIYKQIEIADIIIADLSDRNPNVFYELGFAHAKDKLCILITSDANDLPFDLKTRRNIVYGDSYTYLKHELVKNLDWAKSEIENLKKSPFRVSQRRMDATLIRDSQMADLDVVFEYDINNNLDKTTPEITSIYLYSNSIWQFKQNNKDCPYTESDIFEYNYRYYFDSPVRKLNKNGWAQLSFTGLRDMARAWRGDQILDNYKVTGSLLLRIITELNNYDYSFDVNISASELPF